MDPAVLSAGRFALAERIEELAHALAAPLEAVGLPGGAQVAAPGCLLGFLERVPLAQVLVRGHQANFLVGNWMDWLAWA